METSPRRTLSLQRPLMVGDDVRHLQAMLVKLVDPDLRIDGLFGPRTERAIVQFQKFSTDKLRPDGVCGPETWNALGTAMALRGGDRQAVKPSPIKRALAAVGRFLGK